MSDPIDPADSADSISALTIVRGRRPHLLRQARGLLASETPPHEWIIVSMGEDPPVASDLGLPDGYPLRTDRVDGERALPLALARKRAAERATGRVLVYLDVDCIPAPDCLTHLAATASDGGLWMGDVKYLPKGQPTSDDWTAATLAEVAVSHPLLPVLDPGKRISSPHEMFWSLCFAARRDEWDRIGGFDAGYTGYGAEDTDVSFTARSLGIPFGHVGARAYHQHHPVCQPPLNHVEDLVLNATRFHGKWDLWPMDKWLHALADAGYVRFDPAANVCEVLRLPTDAEVAAATTDAPAGF